MQFRIPQQIIDRLNQAAALEHDTLNGIVVRFLNERSLQMIQKHKQLAANAAAKTVAQKGTK